MKRKRTYDSKGKETKCKMNGRKVMDVSAD